MSVRAFPMPKHPSGCRWCGEALSADGRKGRSWHGGKYGEPDCVYQFQLHTMRDVQFSFVEKRDGLKCWDCGDAPEKWIRDRCETIVYLDRRKEQWPTGEPLPRYVGVRRTTALELEHMAPLWSVAHLSDEERRPFFGPMNLRLRCPDCHGKKSKAEARDRAHMKRLEKFQAGEIKPKRKIPNRGWGNLTRGFDGKPRPKKKRLREA